MSNKHSPKPDEQMISVLRRNGLLDDASDTLFEPLTGGVSSDIWKVSTGSEVYCVKRALSKLKVQADWFAPIERNRYEVAWYQVANQIVPGSAPRVLMHDEEAMLCAMEYLDPATHSLWKDELRDGHAIVEVAAQVGNRLGRIHAGAAADKQVWNRFPRNDIFQEIRLQPYLEATADKHPDLRERLYALSSRTNDMRLTLVHGDISPKNILLGPNGPVFLDAECACIGDPAFDLAFCLNHFLLKCLWTPTATAGFIDCFRAMTQSYLDEVNWEPRDQIEQRTAELLPGLFLARVDGKSPVEYVTGDTDRDRVRSCARKLLLNPVASLDDVAAAWKLELKK